MVIQKITLGFAGGIVSTALTALVCMRITTGQVLPLVLIIVLAALVAALTGLFIGRFSSGLMVGIVYIKVAMILFIAPPILFYLTAPQGSLLYMLSYLFPSSAVFYGLMDMLAGQAQNTTANILALFAHCIIWLGVFLAIERKEKNN